MSFLWTGSWNSTILISSSDMWNLGQTSPSSMRSSSVVFLRWTEPSICHRTYFYTSKGHVTWIIKKVNRIPTHCGVAYESVCSLARGHMIRVCQECSTNICDYNYDFLCHFTIKGENTTCMWEYIVPTMRGQPVSKDNKVRGF